MSTSASANVNSSASGSLTTGAFLFVAARSLLALAIALRISALRCVPSRPVTCPTSLSKTPSSSLTGAAGASVLLRGWSSSTRCKSLGTPTLLPASSVPCLARRVGKDRSRCSLGTSAKRRVTPRLIFLDLSLFAVSVRSICTSRAFRSLPTIRFRIAALGANPAVVKASSVTALGVGVGSSARRCVSCSATANSVGNRSPCSRLAISARSLPVRASSDTGCSVSCCSLSRWLIRANTSSLVSA